VGIPATHRLGAVIAAMSVQWTVARAVACGIWKEGLPFLRTAKGGAAGKGAGFPAVAEAMMALSLVSGAALVLLTNYTEVVEIRMFALVLAVQSLPFISAVAIAALEGSRFNEFAYWRRVALRLAVLRRAAALPERTPDQPSPAMQP
jgi:hypothetical protein